MNREIRLGLIVAAALILVSGVSAQTEQTLYSFSGYADGGNPLSSLVIDAVGNLYGTTFVGGAQGAGAVFELSPNTSGGWTQSVLYSFTGGADGANPYLADVIFDKAGNLYGTTVGGGDHNLGVVFELTPTGNGWSESVLYSFAGGVDGANPYSGLLFDPKGDLYGTTYSGGAHGDGTVYELKHENSGEWKEKVIHTFDGKSGLAPVGGLVFDRRGDLFGTTQGGGTNGAGVVFGLQYVGGDKWTAIVLHNFTGGTDGGYPYAERLILDGAGNLYGTTQGGGISNYGVAFRLSLTKGWKEQVLHEFNGLVESNPNSGLIMDSNGNLYGTCANGDGVTTVGSVFRLTPGAGGKYVETDLHMFTRGDGEFPESALLRDKSGNLYGTTLMGGSGNMGVVFELSK
jgi:uncharacterized repeat protein (TIGR03803 family)